MLLVVLGALDLWFLTQTSERLPRALLWLAIAGVIVLCAYGLVAGSAVRGLRIATGVMVAVLSLGVGAWIGANSPRLTWFGKLVSHGPPGSREVALTFDDGPNAGATLAIARILDAHGVKGTFFEVGKAVDARPDISQALYATGHLLGNHSYHHDSFRWLDPRYPELDRAERSIAQHVGVCPAYYRPPHGQHTPFVARVVHQRGMVMVGWEVSAGDWTSTAPGRLASKILARVHSGQVIDLHDGLDGDVTTDRSVLVRAMPLILDGLERKGLHPVRLDRLLRGRPYLATCEGLRPRRTSTRNAAAGMAARSMAASDKRVLDRYTGTGTSTSFRTR